MPLSDCVESLTRAFFRALTPPRRMTMSEWADEYFYLSPESSASPGKWHTLPYQRDILDACSDPDVEEVWVKKSARVGFTKILDIVVGYHIHQDPCPIMFVQPTIEDAQGTSKEEIDPMLRDTPVLAAIAPKQKVKAKDETILHKVFKGPMGRALLSLVGANSPRGFRRVSRRVVLFDEVDGYPPSAGEEGDQITLGRQRTAYYTNRKIVGGSTPTLKDLSRIDKELEACTVHRRFLPCPKCGHMQFLQWGGKDTLYGIKWEKGRPETARYMCESCHEPIEHKWLRWMDERGEWRVVQPGNPRKKGYIIWAAYSYSPNATWGQLADECLKSQDDPGKEQAFANTVLGESHQEKGEQADDKSLAARLEDGWAPREVPLSVAILVMTVDVQGNRLEAQIVGYGAGEQTWLVDHEVIDGPPEEDSTWADFDAWRLKPCRRVETGAIVPIEICLIDSNYSTDNVVKYVRPRQKQRVFAIRGEEKLAKRSMVQKGATRKERLLQYQIATWDAKRLLQHRLTLVGNRPGQVHLPLWVSDDYLQQITSERMIRHRNRKTGREVIEWIKTRDRNEALDLWVYAIAALRILQEFLHRTRYLDLAVLLAERLVAEDEAPTTPAPASTTPAAPASRPPRRVLLPTHRLGGGGGGW